MLRVNRALCALRNLSTSLERFSFCGDIGCDEISVGVVVFAVEDGGVVLGCDFYFGSTIVNINWK